MGARQLKEKATSTNQRERGGVKKKDNPAPSSEGLLGTTKTTFSTSVRANMCGQGKRGGLDKK